MINIKSSELTPLSNILIFGILQAINNLFCQGNTIIDSDSILGRYNNNTLLGIDSFSIVLNGVVKKVEHIAIYNHALIIEIHHTDENGKLKEEFLSIQDMYLYNSFESLDCIDSLRYSYVNLIINKDE